LDLTYPPAIRNGRERLTGALTGIAIEEELEACGRAPRLWDDEPGPELATEELGSPLAQVVDFRKLGEYVLPVGELLRRTQRRYAPVPRKWSRGGVTPLGWPDATAPWRPGEPLTLEFDGGKLRGQVSIAPFCVPANRLLCLARRREEIVLVKCPSGGTTTKALGDGFVVMFEDAPALLLAEGDEAVAAWQRVAAWEGLALVGLTLGLIDRAWRIALDALCEGKRGGNVLADEQVAQFQLSDNHIDQLSAERLALDVAADAENGRPFEGKLALMRCFTSRQAEACAARALHLASLFSPRMTPIARRLALRAHHLSVFGPAREHQVRMASAALVAGLSME
jgi:hypothetical protein